MFKKVVVMSSLFVLSPVQAKENIIDWGVYGKIGSYSVEDPEGSSGSEVVFLPGAKVVFPISRRGRQFVAGVELIDFSLDASESDVSQDVKGYRIWGGYEHQFSISRNFKIWTGAGLALDSVSYENRYTIDTDGYLDEEFDDRDESNAGITLYALTMFDMGRSSVWHPGIGVYIDSPFGDGVKSLGGTVQIIFD
jgi:hypothetical protein